MDNEQGTTRNGLSRRDLFRTAGRGLAGITLAQILAACGNDDTPAPSATGSGGGFDWAAQRETGSFRWANWPLYMDQERVGGEVTYPTLDDFQEKTGSEVIYDTVINDYASFFAKIEPLLAAGDDPGYDLITMGYPRWLPLMMALDYALELDQDALTNFYRYAAPSYTERSYDPGNRFSIPYQSGITGIGYNPELTGREITSLNDLFDPAFAGKVGMFGDTEDLPNLTLLSIGVDPETSTEADWTEAANRLIDQRDAGIVRQYFGQGYIGALQSGDVALTMAWAPDVLISQNSGYPELEFVVPEEGGLLWTDSLMIPVGARSPLDAMTFIDFLYQPEVAAQITAWVQTVPPVPEAQDVLIREGMEDVARDPLVFPTDEMYSRLHGYRVLDAEQQETWNDLFVPVVQS
ncbi:MAG: spermidine/putrescine ABC transporter substrate-binding protein [Actinomycetota bacterium]